MIPADGGLLDVALGDAISWRDAARAHAVSLEASPAWRAVHDDEGRRVARLAPAEGPEAICGEALFRGGFDEIAQKLLLDREAHKAWDPSLTQFRVLARPGDDHELVLLDVRTGAHPFVQNRELLIHEAIVRSDVGIEAIAASRARPDVPSFAGCLRAELRVSWRRLERQPDGRVRYRALWQTDLLGWMPRSLVAGGQVSAMRAELKRFAAWWPTA